MYSLRPESQPSGTPLRVAILTSRCAPGLDALLRDPNRGLLYDIAAVVTTERAFEGARDVEDATIRVIVLPIRDFLAERELPLRNLNARRVYDEELAAILKGLGVNLVVLCGYDYIVTEALLEVFPSQVIALHDGDLTLRDAAGERLHSGRHAVREAVFGDATETRSSVYFVTASVGAGPVMLLSEPYPIAQLVKDCRALGDAALLTSYAALHRQWMLRGAWGSMLTRCLEFLAAGTVRVVHDLAWIDGVPGPCRMGNAPAMCHDRGANIDAAIPASCPLIRTE